MRNLGVLFDSGLSMEAQVAQRAKSSYYQIRNIGQIRSSIKDDACKTLVHAIATSRLDYGSALLNGLPRTMLQCLQRVPASFVVPENRSTLFAQHTKCFSVCIRDEWSGTGLSR